MDNMQDILKKYYASGGKELFESAEHLAEAPYLDKNYIPVDIDDIIDYHNDNKGMFVSQNFPVIDPYKIQKLTRGATPVVKLDDGYYTFRSEDDKTVHIQKIVSDIDGNYGKWSYDEIEYNEEQSMSIEDFINKARGSDDNISEAPTYPTDTYFVTKADLLKVIDSNYNIDHNKLMQLTDRQKPIIKVIKPIEQPVQMPDIGKIAYRLSRAGLPKPVKKVIEPGVYYLDQDGNGMIDFVGDMVKLLDKNGKEIHDKDAPHVDFSSYTMTDYSRQILIHLKDLINYIQ